MNSTYFFSAFGTFGNPYGFRQSFFLGGSSSVAKEIRTYDLKTDAIKLFPETSIYSMRKDFAGGSNLISYAVYKFAKEQNSDRGGTFIGSSLLFVNKTAPESITINALNDFQNNLEKNNLSEGTITVNHSDHFSVRKPKDFDKIGFNIKEIEDLNFSLTTQSYLVVYCETDASKLQPFFSKALELLNVYDTIYFTQSHEIAEFVKQKGIFKIVDAGGFHKEIEKFHEERNREVQQSIAEFEKEKEDLKEEKKILIAELTQQIESNERRHRENELKIKESKNGIDLIGKEYDQYAGKIAEVTDKLKLDGKVEAAKKKYSEYTKAFTNTISQNKNIDSLQSISSGNSTAREVPQYGNDLSGFRGRERNEEKEFKLDWYKVATFILSFVLIGILTCSFIFLDVGKILGISY
ncbi:hypothetical protein C1637_06235 [Chryseobacterium lactis]|uniref:Uncharacterized protein n=1 Tax=Chryseobacterium lactis TaxID=1241981 RepID=A0A3G6RSH4_CHRLC|nr:hypothetical protein [Chryseobacterium lactis]AZA84438.1 hypothetical protein EG342_22205 [Chryseobacterium lactis]AZB04826.1 hypothetical protein EG341_13085 [Chryseobacterium lactis]PNW14557.1 hypothetical protein C1637_06235 [Chryseobacterium lactis]